MHKIFFFAFTILCLKNVCGQVTLYDLPNFQGQNKSFGMSTFRLMSAAGMNDRASSIKVTPGTVVVVSAEANENGGYGAYVDLMEDCPDLSVYFFNDKISYINVFSAEKPGGFVWARGKMKNNQFVPGHWERKRVNGGPDNSTPAVVSVINEPPPIIPQPVKSTIDETIPVYRIQLRIVTGRRENDDSDGEVFVKLNDKDPSYYLDYGPDDFTLGADKKYDIVNSSIKSIADLQFILIGLKGDDVLGIQRVELYLNNSATPVFSTVYNLSYRINGSGSYARTVFYASNVIRNSSYWQAIATNEDIKKPPVPVPFSMIKSMVESVIGNQLHHRPDHDLGWGNTSGVNTVWGDHVEGKRKDGNTLSFDLDLEYEAPGVNPEVDVKFDLVFECTAEGGISIKTENVKIKCMVAQTVICQTILFYINMAVTFFGHKGYGPPTPDDNLFSAAFTIQPAGFKCKGVLVNADGSVFIY